MSDIATPSLPPTLVCVNPDSDQFGSVAVWSERMSRYGVMNPGITNANALGGHWDDELKPAEDWDDARLPKVKPPAPKTEGDEPDTNN